MYYSLVIIATVLFSLQFLFNQRFQEEYGTDLNAALVFSFYRSVVIVIFMLIISGFRLKFTIYSLIMSVIYTAVCIIMSYFSLKAFSVANLSIYSVFSMLGGMLLPFALGIIFYDESLTVFKVLCCVLIVFSVLLNMKTGEANKKAFIYYIAVFILNGLAGVISKIHQSSSYSHTDSNGFMVISSLVCAAVSGVWLLIRTKKIPLVTGKSLVYVGGYGVFNGLGNLFLLIALLHLPASVQYPLVSGGVIVFSTAVSMIRKEKLTKFDYISAAAAFLASVLIVF